jgi:hypothetical protein
VVLVDKPNIRVDCSPIPSLVLLKWCSQQCKRNTSCQARVLGPFSGHFGAPGGFAERALKRDMGTLPYHASDGAGRLGFGWCRGGLGCASITTAASPKPCFAMFSLSAWVASSQPINKNQHSLSTNTNTAYQQRPTQAPTKPVNKNQHTLSTKTNIVYQQRPTQGPTRSINKNQHSLSTKTNAAYQRKPTLGPTRPIKKTKHSLSAKTNTTYQQKPTQLINKNQPDIVHRTTAGQDTAGPRSRTWYTARPRSRPPHDREAGHGTPHDRSFYQGILSRTSNHKNQYRNYILND